MQQIPQYIVPRFPNSACQQLSEINRFSYVYLQLRSSNDGFSVVADYFGRGVFNKLTLITDPPGGKAGSGSLEADLQRDLLIHTKRNA